MIRFTPEVKEKTLALYKTLSLKELQRRQDLCREQTYRAVKQKNDDALSDLQTMYQLLTDAVDYVAFKKAS